MGQQSKDSPSGKINDFQEETDDNIIDEYVDETKQSPIPATEKPVFKISPGPSSEAKKNHGTLTLEDRLRYSWLEEKSLKSFGLERCDSFTGSQNYHVFKDPKNIIYFFEKHQEKEEYMLAFTVSPYKKS